MQIINQQTLRNWFAEKSLVSSYQLVNQGLGLRQVTDSYIADLLDIPISLCFALESLESGANEQALDSIPLFSLLKGLFLPLSGMIPAKVQQLFNIKWQKPEIPNKEVVSQFLIKQTGLSLSEKIAFLMGDPFCGGIARMGQDTLLQVLSTLQLISPHKLREQLPRLGDIGYLFVKEWSKLRSSPAITAKEAIIILRNLPHQGTNRKKKILRDLFLRCGRLERYFLVRLILRRLNFGYEYRTQLISEALATQYNVKAKFIENGIALSNIFEVAKILEQQGSNGLKKLVLKPLNPVSPALAGTLAVDKKADFPLWVECKYDGIRLMLHKDTNAWGRVKYAAFTRRKHNWLELINNLEESMPYIPGHTYILDGELHGTICDWESHGTRQASVYDIYRYLQGNLDPIVNMKYFVFDVLYYDGQDLTNWPLFKRRKLLEQILAPLKNIKTPLPIVISEGCEVGGYHEFKKWYQYFCQQGHEGVIAKIPDSTYSLGKRTDQWLKKKAELYLDLVVTGAFWATGQRGPQVFSAYQLSCQDSGKWREIGRTEGLAQQNNYEIIQRIAMEGLLSGQVIETRTSSAIRQGIQILPSIVVTVRFDDVVKNHEGICSLRDPKIVCVRPRGDCTPEDIDSYNTISQLYMKKKLG